MAKLTYWVAPRLSDSSVYNIRTKTKREAQALRQQWGASDYGPVTKVEVEYDGAFDLMHQCLSEGAGWWEPYD